jgi:hypothetical protein
MSLSSWLMVEALAALAPDFVYRYTRCFWRTHWTSTPVPPDVGTNCNAFNKLTFSMSGYGKPSWALESLFACTHEFCLRIEEGKFYVPKGFLCNCRLLA